MTQKMGTCGRLLATRLMPIHGGIYPSLTTNVFVLVLNKYLLSGVGIHSDRGVPKAKPLASVGRLPPNGAHAGAGAGVPCPIVVAPKNRVVPKPPGGTRVAPKPTDDPNVENDDPCVAPKPHAGVPVVGTPQGRAATPVPLLPPRIAESVVAHLHAVEPQTLDAHRIVSDAVAKAP